MENTNETEIQNVKSYQFFVKLVTGELFRGFPSQLSTVQEAEKVMQDMLEKTHKDRFFYLKREDDELFINFHNIVWWAYLDKNTALKTKLTERTLEQHN